MPLKKFIPVILLSCFLWCCSKPSDPVPPVVPPAKPLSFTVTVNYRTETSAAIQWTSAAFSQSDSIRYAVELDGVKKESGLTGLTDTLKGILPDNAYTGKVIASNKNGDTTVAAFVLPSFQGYAYVTSENTLGCLTITTWKPKWTLYTSINKTWTPPTIHGDTLFAAAQDVTTGFLVAVNKKDGTIIWRVPVPANSISPEFSPVLTQSNGRLLFIIGSEVFAVSSRNGQLLWKNNFTGFPVQVSLAIAGNNIYAGANDKKMYALDAGDGHILWSYLTNAAISFCYAAADNNAVYFGNNAGNFYAVGAKAGNLLWKVINTTGNAVNNAPVLDGNTLFTAMGDGDMFSINIATSQINWKLYETNTYQMGITTIGSQLLYVLGLDVNYNGRVMAMDKVTGAIRWLVKPIYAVYDGFIAANNRIYYLGLNNFITLDAATGQLINATLGGAFAHASSLVLDINGTVSYQTSSPNLN